MLVSKKPCGPNASHNKTQHESQPTQRESVDFDCVGYAGVGFAFAMYISSCLR